MPTARGRWRPHVHPACPKALHGWLTLESSLTAQLRAHGSPFRVQRLKQRNEPCLADEAAAIGQHHRFARVREVLLHCGGKPVVFAHTVVPLASMADWPTFGALGERSLGELLFGDRQVARGRSQFARLDGRHPLVRRLRAALPAERIESRLHARRRLFQRKNGLMLVTEVFLPGIINLQKLTEQ
ncbi:MAG: chorismate--pyruvate lyase [Burkholderiaceae bacterium]|nr:chorismate--pyruvate lyase [Burkholderiaceae bacterium]